MEPVTDIRDLRVLIPATRRAIDGPQATGSASVATTLSDEEVLGLVADAAAEVILLTGGSSMFGYQLVVTERDPNYMAPVAWATDTARDSNADVVIRSQAAINFFFQRLRDMKIQEEISDEGQTWSYQLSANLVRDQLKLLADQRDRALAAMQAIHAPLDTYVSTVAERDLLAASYLEPYVAEIGAPVPYSGMGGAMGPGAYDWRFGSFG